MPFASLGHMDISGRVALVTGAARGIGRATALALATAGAQLIISDVNEAGLSELADLLKQRGRLLLSRCVDVSDRAQMQAFAEAVHALVPAVDILVNNAGVGLAGGIETTSLDDWKWVLGVNLWGVIHGCHAFIPMLMRQESGYVLNMASSAGLFALPEMAQYSVPKAAVIALSETMRAELARCGIGVTVSCPAAFASDILNKEGVDVTRSVTLRALDKDAKAGRHTAESVAAHAIRTMERGRLYDIAHDSMEVLWFVKRLMPETIYQLFAWMYANRKWKFKD